MAWVVLTLICLACSSAWADDVHRTVVLNVSGGETQLLVAEIEAVPNVELRDQGWFLKQVRSRGMRPAKLLARPADLRFVMSGSNIAFVIHVNHEDGVYEGRVYGVDGELVGTTALGGEFGQVEAAQVRAAFEKVLGIEEEPVAAIEVGVDEVEPHAVVGDAEEEVSAPVDGAPTSRRPSRDTGFELSLGARIFQRALSFTGGNNAVLNFESAFYPGFALAAGFVPDSVKLGPGQFGLWLAIEGGFDSISGGDGSVSVLHLDGASGVALHFDVVTLHVGARHVRYSVADADVFPSLTHTLALLGVGAEQQLGSWIFGGDAEIYPWGFYGARSARLFGEGSRQIGFASGIRIGLMLGQSVGIVGGYRFRTGRSSFSGRGSLDFADTRGFELVHGPELGVTWHP